MVVPTRSAARQLRKLLGETAAELVTREQMYDAFHARLSIPPRRLTSFERDAVAQASAVEAAGSVPDLSFQLRPGLVTEMLRFYDQLRRQSQRVDRFEELMTDAVGGEPAPGDRGAERLLHQTQFLANAFRNYEQRVSASDACDEHGLRDRLIAETTVEPVRHVIVTVSDWIADPDGLFAADFDLLARIPGLETLDIVSTEALLGSGFDERVRNWWPGLEDIDANRIAGTNPRIRPILLTPKDEPPEQPWFTRRDREEELLAVARQRQPGSVAAVFKRPLPYLYLAPETFGASGVPYESSDAWPLAAEPTAAAVDLILELVETNFVRSAIIALLRSPHFRFPGERENELAREAISALDSALGEARYLGEPANLEALMTDWSGSGRHGAALAAMYAAVDAGREVAPLLEPARASRQLRVLLAFLDSHLRPLDESDPFAPRERRGRAAVVNLLKALATAHEAHHDPVWTIDDLAASVRRWIGEETFVPDTADVRSVRLQADPRSVSLQADRVQLLDDQAVRYGAFDHLALVGLVEHEWPDRPRPNIFYPARMLKSLGWPSEKDRHGAADARFLDLLASASRTVTVSTFSLDEDALVMRSAQLDEIARAGLSTLAIDADSGPLPSLETLADAAPPLHAFDGPTRDWLEMRLRRPGSDTPAFHGSLGPREAADWTVSALETYLGCPFRFFALHVLKLKEEPDDEEVMDPRRQGALVHQVFEEFFKTWQAARWGAITPENLDQARETFERVVDRALAGLPLSEAGLERTRLLGSPAAAGLGEAVFRMEAERPVAVVERLLEHNLAGTFSILTSRGPREVFLRGKVDRLDLLEDGTFRLIDYKLGWPPNRARALQLPIYGICAQQRLANHRGRAWTLGEAAYLAFKGPKRVVPLFGSTADRDKALGDAQQRLADTLDAIERGEFPPTPDNVYRCETCSVASVCRKDYVGDVRT